MPTYERFPFIYHQTTHQHPAGDQMQMGSGYAHAAEADEVVQRSFTLSFNTLLHIRNPYTGTWLRLADTRVDAGENEALDELKAKSILCLDDFYAQHRLHKIFEYDHELFGVLLARFSTAFTLPATSEGVRGIYDNIPTTSFEVKLIEMPL